MRKIAITGIITAIAIWSTVPTMAQLVSVHGQGNRSCGTFVTDFQNSVSKSYYQTWLSGFISGANAYSASRDSLNSTDLEGATRWILNYCNRNPTKTFFAAAQELILFLAK